MLAVRMALARGVTLCDFIARLQPLPFIRPPVRTLLLCMRSQRGEAFAREVRAVIDSDAIAYHLKRLIVESLAELVPVEADWGMIRHLAASAPELFRRLLWRVTGRSWLQFLAERWLPRALQDPNSGEQCRALLFRLGDWLNDDPEAIVSLWRTALTSGRTVAPRLHVDITYALDKFAHWGTVDLRELLALLIERTPEADAGLLGRVLSRWVEATNSGDDLLWSWICRDASIDDFRDPKLHCAPHEFHSVAFLSDRLKHSPSLLDEAFGSTQLWPRADHDPGGVCAFVSMEYVVGAAPQTFEHAAPR